MRDHRPSFTAAWVAACRGLGAVLPAHERLCDDPYGLAFASPVVRALGRAAARVPQPLRAALPYTASLGQTIVYMQLRTRYLDDVVRAFVRDGGRQLVLLGAGFDCRAWRLADELAGATVFEVDHPATQARKRDVIAPAGRGVRAANVRFVPWHFERDGMTDLPARLAAEGHDPARPTLTLWEGVTMYLTPPAIEASVAAVRAYSAPGSLLAMTYFDRATFARPSWIARLSAAGVARVGEPFRFGWDPRELPAWLAARGFTLQDDQVDQDLVRARFAPRYARLFPAPRGHLCVAGRTA